LLFHEEEENPMGNIAVKISCVLVFIVSMAACTGKAPEVIEVTRVVPQTVEVTRIAPQTVIATQIVRVMAASTPEPVSTAAGTPGLVDIDPVYFDGIIVITQYYTFLDLGLYKDAYQLLHSGRPHPQSLGDFLYGAEKAFKSVEIQTIQPYNVWARRHGINTSGDPEGQMRFYVEIIVEGEEGWWQSANVHFIFSLARDNGKLRIFSQDTIAKK
jgi:hypothetical protein